MHLVAKRLLVVGAVFGVILAVGIPAMASDTSLGPVYLGTGNAEGSAVTSISASGSAVGFRVSQSGTGGAIAGSTGATGGAGVRGNTGNPAGYGFYAANLASSPGPGAAMFALNLWISWQVMSRSY